MKNPISEGFRKVLFPLIFFLLAVCLSLALIVRFPQSAPAAAFRPKLDEAFGRLPLSFEPNQGQLPAEVLYRSRGLHYELQMRRDGMTVHLGNASTRQAESAGSSSGPETLSEIQIRWPGAKRAAQVIPLDPLPGKINYLLGNQPERWRTNIPTYAKVKYAQIYPGIDLVFYGNQQQLEYDFVVAPGADPGTIRLALRSAHALRLDQGGNLNIIGQNGQLRLQRPLIYQQFENQKRLITGGFQVSDGNEVTFEVGAYDTTKPLLIDPILSYSSFIGSSGTDVAFSITTDAAGSIYLTGWTGGSNFPTANPPISTRLPVDAFVTKLNPSGTALVFSTFLGGVSQDAGQGIVVDTTGNTYVAGVTSSNDFPTTRAFQRTYGGGASDVFLCKINAAGSALLFSTYLGGNGSEGTSWDLTVPILGLAVDGAGSAVVAGQTASANFPLANPLQSVLGGGTDAFISKFSPDGTGLLFSTYLGGAGTDAAASVAVDASGKTFLTGRTDSLNFPLANPFQSRREGFQNAFVTCLNPSGTSLLYSTYLGGNSSETGYGIALDNAGSAYVTGATFSRNFPLVGAFQRESGGNSDAFVTKFSPSGSSLVYSTYLGGTEEDLGAGIKVDAAGNAHITGHTASMNFPQANPFQTSLAGFTCMKSVSAAASWASSSSGMEVLAVAALAVDPSNSSVVYAGTPEGVFKSINGGKNWFPFNAGLIPPVEITEVDLAALASQEQFFSTNPLGVNSFAIVNAGGYSRIYCGFNSGLAWLDRGKNEWKNMPFGTVRKVAAANVPAVLQTPYQSAGNEQATGLPFTVFFQTMLGIYRMIPQGHWVLVNEGLPLNRLTSFGVDQQGNAYAVVSNPLQIFKLARGASSWGPINTTWSGTTQPPSTVTILAFDPQNPQILYAGTTFGPFRSSDGGSTWSLLGRDLQYVSISALALDPMNPNILYAGTSRGVFKSTNGGSTWVETNTGFPIVAVNALAVDPGNPSTLFAGISRGSDAFITRFNSSGSSLYYSSLLGGSSDDWGVGISLDGNSNAFICGGTSSADFPTVTPYNAVKQAFQDAFMAKVVPFSLIAGAPRGALDTPAPNSTVQGPITIGGWAAVVSGNTASVAARLDLYVDGSYVGPLRSGISRPDVRQFLAGQGITAPDNLGFAEIWDSQRVGDGPHRLSVRAADVVGMQAEAITEIISIMINTNNGIPTTTTTTTTTSTTETTTTTTTTTTSTTSTTTTTTTSTSTTTSTTTTTTTTTSSTTSTLPVFYRHYFPKVIDEGAQYTGLAVVNLSSSAASVELRAFSNSGKLLAFETKTIQSREQLAGLLFEILPSFGKGTGWVEMVTTVAEVQGFFLLFDAKPTFMDGVTVLDATSRDFIISAADNAEISLVNPAGVEVVYGLQHVSSDGTASSPRQGTIPANGRAVVDANALRPAGTTGGYLRGTSTGGTGLVPLSLFGKSGWLAALPAQAAETQEPAGPRILYAPQYVVGGGYDTVLDIVNLENVPITVSLRLFSDAGVQLGNTGTTTLPARGSVRISSPAIFGLSVGAGFLQGYVRLESNAGRFVGSVLFTDPEQNQFGSALPFVAGRWTNACFSQVAQNEQYFTGLAVLNPNSGSAAVRVTVMDIRGTVIASGTRSIPAGGRFSNLLPELVGTLPAMGRGYFLVQSDLPVAGFALFGTATGEVLAAIPPQGPSPR